MSGSRCPMIAEAYLILVGCALLPAQGRRACLLGTGGHGVLATGCLIQGLLQLLLRLVLGLLLQVRHWRQQRRGLLQAACLGTRCSLHVQPDEWHGCQLGGGCVHSDCCCHAQIGVPPSLCALQ